MASTSAIAWIAWADEVFGELRSGPDGVSPCAQLLCGAGGFLEQWKHPGHSMGGTFKWRAEADPDALESLIHGFSSLDLQLALIPEGGPWPAPCHGRDFYVVLVRDLLRALEMEGPGRAAFVGQLRDLWPSAAQAS